MTWITAQRPFVIPSCILPSEHLNYCIGIINRYRQELPNLRMQSSKMEDKNRTLEEEVAYWKKKYKEKEQEVDTLKKEIEKLTKTNNRYQVGLFDHGNFKHPSKGEKKPKGGQKGHSNTNKDNQRNYDAFERVRVYAHVCGKCGRELNRVSGINEKTVIDIQMHVALIEMIVQSERQWCGSCHREVTTSHPQSLPFTEYGMNTFMTVMYLRCKGKQSIRTIAATLDNLFGLPISKSGVETLLSQAKTYLEDKYEELKKAIRNSELMYNDETGWMVRGKSAWIWIMTTPDKKNEDGTMTAGMTVYVAAESKGKGIFEDMYGNAKAYSMHDGNPSYEAVTGKEKSAYCWSHVIRFAYEETVRLSEEHLACRIRDRLVTLYQNIRTHAERTKEEKEVILRKELESILSIQSTDETVSNILQRLQTQKEGLLLALLITKDGTNNLAEREFRQLVINRTISYGSDTYTGMEKTAILSSIVQTISRDKTKPFFNTLTSYLHEGIQKKHPQYKHTSHFDT
jgi:hypothetical protein